MNTETTPLLNFSKREAGMAVFSHVRQRSSGSFDVNVYSPSHGTSRAPLIAVDPSHLTKRHIAIVGVVLLVSFTAIGLGLGFGIPALRSKSVILPHHDPPSKDIDEGIYVPAYNLGNPMGRYKNAAVCADATPCATIGKEILQKNGSAVDAAIAAMLCDGVVNAHSMGIGGGFVMTIYHRANKTAETLISREKAPALANETMFEGNSSLSQKGGLSVGVPGEIRGYWEAWTKYGKLNWTELLQPTIDLCKNGITVVRALAKALQSYETQILEEPSMKEVFVNPETGKVWKEGEIMKRPQLALTLERIAVEGPNAFYNSNLTDAMAEEIRSHGGVITKEDFSNYTAKWTEPIKVALNGGMTLYSVPPPASGAILAFILNILDTFNVSTSHESMTYPEQITLYHRMVEAFKWAYARRTELGDPDFANMTELVRNLTSETYAMDIAQQINDNQTYNDPEHYGAEVWSPEDSGTAHVSVVAPNGDAVAITSTINLYFGAGFRSNATGVIFNDEMDDFSSPNLTNYFGMPPSPNNFIVPGKRPVSSMCPTIITDSAGNPRLVVGAAGGTRITSAVAYVIIRNLWFGEDIKMATDAYRIHHQLFPMTLSYEQGFPPGIIVGLEGLGHKTKDMGPNGFGAANCNIAFNTSYAEYNAVIGNDLRDWKGHNVTESESSAVVVSILKDAPEGDYLSVFDWRKIGETAGY
ncbi:unnamed protein product [Darwinula stevensoni]|uniref:Gamma-glutamyltranspeptidase n=1 Tax=Darwinula stevensoni TaxID=69355 RepID=A0A7R8X9F0_9CRUS|nr:unnamed protein product [Darwinula stevensoni]CAG0890582.1 unnamed protein product [Darwinula stevensoni]